jgi:transcriptional regulator
MVLAVVEDQPRHGYDIARRIDETSGGLLRFHVASLYPMLYRMEQKGWIQGRWIEKAGQRRRRYYRLTPVGRTVLAAQRREWQSLVSALDRVAKISMG